MGWSWSFRIPETAKAQELTTICPWANARFFSIHQNLMHANDCAILFVGGGIGHIHSYEYLINRIARGKSIGGGRAEEIVCSRYGI